MTRKQKKLDKMRNNPRGDWQIDDLKSIAEDRGIAYRQNGTSHVVFDFGDASLTVPAHRPIKPIYITKFIELLGGDDE